WDVIWIDAVSAIVPVFHNYREPWRAISEFLDLNGLFDDYAIRSQPTPGAYAHIQDAIVSHTAYVGLCIHCERDVLPRVQLNLRECYESFFSRQIIGKGIWQVTCVAFTPESIH